MEEDELEIVESIKNDVEEPLGWSSDSDVEGSTTYRTRTKKIRSEARTIFNDTKKEFCSVDAIQKLLETWKKRFPEEYQECYIPSSVPVLVAPYVLLELLEWEPLEQPSLDHFQWGEGVV